MKLLTLIFFLLPLLSNAQIFVDQNANGSNDGTSWANAYTDLQDAIQNASSGAEVWVAAGAYLPSTTGNVEATFALTQSIALYGGFAGTETSLDERDVEENLTTLSGDYNNNDVVSVNTDPLSISYNNYVDNARRILTASNVAGSIVLDGFTVSGGNSFTSGAGLLFSPDVELTVVVRNCILRDNLASGTAGAIRLGASDNEILNFRLENVTAVHNSCTGFGSKGAVVWATGGGITFAEYVNVLFHQNFSSSRGGATTHDIEVHASYDNCIFSENRASSGGATFEDVSVASFYRNCTFYKNTTSATNGASVIHSYNDFGSENVNLENCIFFGNGARPLLGNGSTDFTISNTIIEYNNWADFMNDANGSIDLGGIQYNVNPEFVDVSEFDFNLNATSPAINIGNNASVQGVHDHTGYIARIVDATVDLGALEYHLPLISDIDHVLCFGEDFGSASVSLENYPPFTYAWSDPSIQGPNPTNLVAGEYELTVTNFIGDFEVLTFTLVENPEIIVTFNVTDPTGGNPDGAAMANVSSGTFPFTYEWNTDPVQTTSTASGLPDGTYTVTVTDDEGCTIEASVDVGEPSAVQSVDDSNEIEIGPNPFNGNVQVILSGSLMENSSLSKVLIYDTAGRIVYRGSLSADSNNSIDLSHLSAGLYFMELAGDDLRFRKRLVKQ